MPYLLFLKKQQIRNCRLLQIIGGALMVKSWCQNAGNGDLSILVKLENISKKFQIRGMVTLTQYKPILST